MTTMGDKFMNKLLIILMISCLLTTSCSQTSDPDDETPPQYNLILRHEMERGGFDEPIRSTISLDLTETIIFGDQRHLDDGYVSVNGIDLEYDRGYSIMFDSYLTSLDTIQIRYSAILGDTLAAAFTGFDPIRYVEEEQDTIYYLDSLSLDILDRGEFSYFSLVAGDESRFYSHVIPIDEDVLIDTQHLPDTSVITIHNRNSWGANETTHQITDYRVYEMWSYNNSHIIIRTP
jgi:hypothetical protein